MKIREAGAGDAARLERLRVRGWREAYPGLVAQHVLDALSPDDPAALADWQRLLDDPGIRITLAEDAAGHLTGFCALARPSRDPDEPPGVAELVALYVDPEHHRRGIGRTLIDDALALLRTDGGWHECTVWTLDRNDRALTLYGSLGFLRDGTQRTDEHWLHPDVRLRLAL